MKAMGYLEGLRRKHGWSVTEVALRGGVHSSTYHRWESGKTKLRDIPADRVRRLALTLGVPFEALVKGQERRKR